VGAGTGDGSRTAADGEGAAGNGTVTPPSPAGTTPEETGFEPDGTGTAVSGTGTVANGAGDGRKTTAKGEGITRDDTVAPRGCLGTGVDGGEETVAERPADTAGAGARPCCPGGGADESRTAEPKVSSTPRSVGLGGGGFPGPRTERAQVTPRSHGAWRSETETLFLSGVGCAADAGAFGGGAGAPATGRDSSASRCLKAA
jgi:hypothetical protein